MSTYWCHQCRKTITPISNNGMNTCPECQGDFIEMIEDERASNPTDHPSQFIMASEPSNVPQSGQMPRPMFFPFPGPQRQQPVEGQPQVQQINFSPFPFLMPPNVQQGGGQPSAGGVEGVQVVNLDTMLNQLFGAPPPSANGQGGGPNNGADPLQSFLQRALGIHGNIGDYAFGPQFEHLMNNYFNSAGGNGNPPASEKEINSLPTETIVQHHIDTATDCSICKEEYTLGENVIKLPCNHLYHKDCIVQWLKMHNQCPVCRHELPTDDAQYEEKRKSQNQ
ncbi:RING finger protein [Planoprotostelium fungivorum]|uniref:RING-type E3 ubiquitin transferase n=1 Tax=Planoprotostelium fungivorum TaxID=1890364 RepID=A0A2P6NHT4_9EUKA|nr:RING finger protein [Planoprotostelium fungivorum]